MTAAHDGSVQLSSAAPEELAFGTDAPLHNVMQTMRAMRRLKPDPVPTEMLNQLVEAATWAPSASNSQSFTWVVVTDRGVMERLAPLWDAAVEFYLATVARVPGESMDEAQAERMYRALRYQRDHFRQIPALIVPCYDLSWQRRGVMRRWPSLARAWGALGPRNGLHLARNMGRSSEMAEAASVYPGVQNLLLTARALGLGATITTIHLLLEGRFKRVLGIPGGVKTFAIVPVGWPRGKFGAVRRRSATEAIKWDGWS